jgi:hypothetical protein
MEKTQENIIQNKKSFILYLDSADIFDQLTDQEAGKLIKAVLYYVHTGEKPELPRLLNMAFIPIYQALHRDLEKWRKQVEANRKNGKTGGRPPKEKTEDNPINPSGYSNNPINPDNVTDTDTVNDKIKYSSDFESVFFLYPSNRRTCKKDCYKYFKQIPKDKIDIFTKKLKAYISNNEKENYKYVKQSQRYFKDWETVIDAEVEVIKEKSLGEREAEKWKREIGL